MDNFEWTYDIEAPSLHIGAEFIINEKSDEGVGSGIYFHEGEFYLFKIIYIGLNMDEFGKTRYGGSHFDEMVVGMEIIDTTNPSYLIDRVYYTTLDKAENLIETDYWLKYPYL